MEFPDPDKPIATCSSATCDACPVNETLHCHFTSADLLRFLSISMPSFLFGGGSARGFPDNYANTEPDSWYAQSESWGFAARLGGEATARTIPLAEVAEMADRVQADNWSPNLDSAIVIP